MALSEPNTAAVDFINAVHTANFDLADSLLPHLSGPHDAPLRRALADLHTQRQRWDDAADALEGVPGEDTQLRRNLCRNLASLRTHRPTIYRVALDAIEDPAGPHRPHRLAGGAYTVAHVDRDTCTPMSPDPIGQVRQAMIQLKPTIERGDSIALLSIGDGHALAALAANAPTLFLGRQQPLFLFEPDATLLVACLLIHDFTGPLGPIEQPRVLWYVGVRWSEAFRVDVMTDRFLLFPKINVKQGGGARAIEESIVATLGELGRSDATAGTDVQNHYAALTAADHARALRGEAGRPPRVMLLTTRFSTVLQHSTRDADDAFRRLGCDTVVLIEPTTHHGMTRSSIRRTLADFKPDLIFQIDHHRFEHADLFPLGLPFVNWIQDLLPHLMTATAGRQLGSADFSLTPSLQRWVDDFAYPVRQCLEFRKLTRVPPRPPAQQSDSDRVVYVSNWSQSTGTIVAELLANTTGPTRDVTAAACERMIAIYATGDCLASAGDVRRLVVSVMAEAGVQADEAFVRHTTTRLTDRLNNLLYRHRALTWAADACDRLGLRLEIYGSGWAAQPRFAKYAQGAIAYGAPLETLTRNAAVNLILEPFMCLAHQRVLDALAAGGFCLIHDHAANHTCTEWIDLLSRSGPDVQDARTLRSRLHDDDPRRFDANFAECERLDYSPGRMDHVATVVRMQRSGFFPTQGQVLPLLDRVAFSTGEGLSRLLAKATQNPEFRKHVAGAQRKCVESRYSYHAGMARVLAFVGARLAEPALPRSNAA